MLPDVHEVHLNNGLRALLVERPSLPVVASTIWYDVGSRDERTGETGLSHFLEHMMFKGTDRYAKGEIDLVTSLMGGSNNAFTDNDLTAYYFSLAADRWEAALEIEASRMRGCTLDDEEFQAEKQVVLEELAMYQDDPWSALHEATEAIVFHVHPYHHPIIGWKEDLERLQASRMRDYYSRHYGPNRALLVVVGDIDKRQTEGRIRELFDGIPCSDAARAPVLAEPPAAGERRATIRAPGSTTRMTVAVRTCRMGEQDDFHLDALSCVLSSGKGSRLYREMVLDNQMVTDVSTHNEPRLDPGVFWFSFELLPGVEPAAVEESLRTQLRRVAEEGATDDELRRARTQLLSSFLFEEETALDSALKIGRWEAQCQGGYKLLAEVEPRYGAADSDAMQEVTRRYFDPDTWNVVVSLPTENGKANGNGNDKANGNGKANGKANGNGNGSAT